MREIMVIPGGWPVSNKHCEKCKSGTAAIFCRTEMAFLCFSCDSRIHRTDTKFPVRHEHVLLCEVCEQAPDSITCRTDAAELCVLSDADIRSANNLASHHDRVPVEPFFDTTESIISSASLGLKLPPAKIEVCGGTCRQDELEAVSWLLPNLNRGDFKVVEGEHMKVAPTTVVDNHGLFLNEMESLPDLEFRNGWMDWFHSEAMDILVPAHTKPVPALANTVISQNQPQENCFSIDFCRSKLSSFVYSPPSRTQNASSSSLDVGVVPEGPLSNNSADPGLTNTASSLASQTTQLCRTDREARVLRYREKRKNRKFEKTIHYTSRKAYAETRPRIKGRFAKRSVTEIKIESNIDNYFFSSASSTFMADVPNGSLPTF